MNAPSGADPAYGRRHLPVAGFIGLAVAWLLIIKVVGLVVEDTADVEDGRLLTTEQLWWSMILPIGLACAFVYLVITVLGWWRVVLYDPKPVKRWVWAIPVVFAVAIAAGINYGELIDKGAGFTLALLAVAMVVGFGEEGMFRAIGVNTFRRNAYSERRVALWSSLTFGLVHVANIIGGDSRAFAQAIIVSFAGYFLYLIRRVSRSNILNSVLHGMFDFTILTGTVIIPEGEDAYPGALLAILVYLACGIMVVVKRHDIEPGAAASIQPSTPAT